MSSLHSQRSKNHSTKREVLEDPAISESLLALARESGRPLEELNTQAAADLSEMRCNRSLTGVKLFAALSRFMYRRGYSAGIDFDSDDVERIRKLTSEGTVVFLVTHKTYLDFFVLFDFLYRSKIMPPYIFGGINMNFAAFGALAKRAGGIFIRRSFRNDAVYKAVLKRYIASLIERKQHFMWAIEGTRSRTGKLVRPRLGLLKYVVAAGSTLERDAVTYVPVSVAYDQIPDVIDMAAQESGGSKKGESLGWFLRYAKRLGGRYGRIYLRFGDPVALHETPDAPDLTDSQLLTNDPDIEIQKLAFEVCYRINEITPATPTSLVILSLLCRDSVTEPHIRADVQSLSRFVTRRNELALPGSVAAYGPGETGTALALLERNGVIRISGDPVVYSIDPDQLLVAHYYCNMAVHHFVVSAFVEVALLRITEQPGDAAELAFWVEVLRLRDLFKFEFFFARKDAFEQQMKVELELLDNRWEDLFTRNSAAVVSTLEKQRLLVAHGVLSPFVDAYRVVADHLVQAGGEAVHDIGKTIRIGQRTPRSLIRNGINVAENRSLLQAGDEDLAARRREFAAELADISRLLEKVRQMTI